MNKATSIVFLVCAVLISSCKETESLTSPNILWIIAEDLSPDLGCYGHALVKTPFVDQLATEGVRFTNVFTTAPVCTPSRTALATGMYQTSIDAHHMRYPDSLKTELPADVIPVNEIFRRNGYQTFNLKSDVGTGKTDWSFKSGLSAYDHDSWDTLDPDKSFFGVVNLRLTHRPFEKDEQHPIDAEFVTLPPYYPDHPVARQDWADYLETVQLMDTRVGKVLHELKERGWEDNTIVYFFSDHGRPFSRGKMFLYDSGIEIPLIIKSPQSIKWYNHLPKGTVNDQLISSIDLAATSLSMAGITKPSAMQGRIFLGKNEEPERVYVFSAADRIGEVHLKSRAVRSRDFKFIRNYHHHFSVNEAATAYRKANHPIYQLLDILEERNQLPVYSKQLVEVMAAEELYDLKRDPFEVSNLADDPAYREIISSFRKELTDWQKETKDYGMKEDPPALIKAFEFYGEESEIKYKERADKLKRSVAYQIGNNS